MRAGIEMETRETSLRLRSSTLWVPGVLAVVLGVSIHTQVVSLHDRARLVAHNAVACTLPVDLNDGGTGETVFVPAVSRGFAFSLVLRTAAAEDGATDAFPDNAIAESLKAATFEVAWQLHSEGQSSVGGSISERSLHTRITTDDIRYVFGNQELSLQAGRSYKLVTTVLGPSPALNEFAPVLVVKTTSPLKGHPLARWRLKDTGLLLFLGSSLIALGLSKRYSDRKRRRLAAVRSATAP